MESRPRIYRPRRPQQTPLFRLLESLFEPVKRCWEDRFEARYGFWQGCWEQAVAPYLDCGVWKHGFARVRCGECRYEMLVAFSCKQRELCPSCAAKRGAELAAFFVDHVLEDAGHAQWVFTIPMMLRPLFFRRRELRGTLGRIAWRTVQKLMTAAASEPELRPGMVSEAIEALVRYTTRPPVRLARLRLLPGEDRVRHFPKTGGDDPGHSDYSKPLDLSAHALVSGR